MYYACVEGRQKSMHGTFLYHSLPYFLSQALLLSLDHYLSQTDCPVNPWGPHSSIPKCWGYRLTLPCLVVIWVLGIWSQVLLLSWQVLYPLNHLPSSLTWEIWMWSSLIQQAYVYACLCLSLNLGGCWGLNSGPQAYTASTSPIEPFPQPLLV